MPRTSPSAADQQLVAHVAHHGQVVTARQVERWRGHGLLPANNSRGLGRGRGSTSEPAPEAFDLVLWLAQHAGPGRRPHDLALGAFAAGLPVPEATVRAAFVQAINTGLAIRPTMPVGADAEDIAQAVAAAGWRGSLTPARIRQIDRAMAASGVNLADPSLTALDPGFGSGTELATGDDWTFAAVHMTLAGGSAIDMATIGALARSLLPAGVAAPLAGQVEYRWPITEEPSDDPLNTEEGLRALVPDGDLRVFLTELASTTPLAELRDAWRVHVECMTWSQDLCTAVEQELAAHVRGPATQEWITSTFGLGRLILTIALRDPQPGPATLAVRALTLMFVQTMIRQVRQMWPVEGNFHLLENPVVGPRFLVGFIAG
jgi:hypothetical protein